MMAGVTIENKAAGAELSISIHGAIGVDVTSGAVALALEGFDGDVISLSINSAGGSAADGIAIFNLLRRHQATVNVNIDGLAASAASVIAMAGDWIEMSDSSMLMIHDPLTQMQGNSAEMRETAEILDKWAHTIAMSYRRHARLELEEIRELMAQETWLTAQEAMEMGLAHSVYSEDDDEAEEEIDASSLMILAQTKILAQYKNTPKNLISKEGQMAHKNNPLKAVKLEEVKEPMEAMEEEEKKKAKAEEEKDAPEAEEVEPESMEEEKPEAEEMEEKPEAEEDEETPKAEDEEKKKEEAEAMVKNQLKAYMNSFGENGAEWFTAGLSWDACRQKQVEQLQAKLEKLQDENTSIKNQLSAGISVGESEPVSISAEGSAGTGFASRLRMPGSSNN